MSGTFLVDPGEMEQTAGTLSSRAENLASELQNWNTSVQNLLGHGFQTMTASAKFEETWQQFQTSVTQVQDSLKGLGQFLKGAADGTNQFDSQLASSLNKK